jgi:hypothetical protein
MLDLHPRSTEATLGSPFTATDQWQPLRLSSTAPTLFVDFGHFQPMIEGEEQPSCRRRPPCSTWLPELRLKCFCPGGEVGTVAMC